MRNTVKIIILGLLAIAGCRSIHVDLPDGRKVDYLNVGFDTKIGVLEIETDNGSKLRLENVDSASQGMVVAGKALDLAAQAANPLP